jgi:transcriptional regulator with XRE-family HTH domain
VTGSSPTIRQRELGKRLRDLRNQHGLTVEEVAEKLLCSATKISRLETGARRPSLRDVRDLCSLYDVADEISAELMELARGAREQGWWTKYDDLNLDPLIGLEQAASAITCYSMFYIPALLQTESYAREIIRAVAPKMDPYVYQQRVEVRVRRQELLAEANRPRYRVLLDEAVLLRRVGSAQLMATQFERVLEAARQDKVTVQIIPFDSGAYEAADGYFVLLEFDDPDLSPVVFTEGLTGNRYFDRKIEIDRYREAIEGARDSALSPRDSLKRLDDLRKAYLSE